MLRIADSLLAPIFAPQNASEMPSGAAPDPPGPPQDPLRMAPGPPQDDLERRLGPCPLLIKHFFAFFLIQAGPGGLGPGGLSSIWGAKMAPKRSQNRSKFESEI